MIKTFRMYRLPNAEYVQFIDYVVTLVQDKNPTGLNVKTQHDALSLKLTELKNLFQPALASSFTKKLKEANTLRDEILTGLIKMVDANAYHYQKNIRPSANLLQKNIKLYGSNIIRDNFQRETAKIESLVGDWQNKADLVTAVDMLGLISWVTQLKNSNNEFKRLYALRNDEYSQRPEQNMESKRIEVNAAYEDLCKFLNSYSVIESSNPDYEVVISGINSYVDHYSTLLKQTRSGKKVEKPPVN